MSSSGIGRDVTRRLGEEMSTAKLSLSPLKGHDGLNGQQQRVDISARARPVLIRHQIFLLDVLL